MSKYEVLLTIVRKAQIYVPGLNYFSLISAGDDITNDFVETIALRLSSLQETVEKAEEILRLQCLRSSVVPAEKIGSPNPTDFSQLFLDQCMTSAEQVASVHQKTLSLFDDDVTWNAAEFGGALSFNHVELLMKSIKTDEHEEFCIWPCIDVQRPTGKSTIVAANGRLLHNQCHILPCFANSVWNLVVFDTKRTTVTYFSLPSNIRIDRMLLTVRQIHWIS